MISEHLELNDESRKGDELKNSFREEKEVKKEIKEGERKAMKILDRKYSLQIPPENKLL